MYQGSENDLINWSHSESLSGHEQKEAMFGRKQPSRIGYFTMMMMI
jgi:hypothetical protein